MKKILLILSFYLTLTLCCNAQKFISCDIEAGINNEQPELTTDTGGTNIRTGPGKNFAVLKTLKSETGFLFHITAAQDDWMQISSVFYIGEDRTKPLKGWIYAPSLFLKVGSNVNTKHNDGGLLFAAPQSEKP